MKRNQFFSCKGIQMMLLAVLMLLPSEVYSRIDEDNGLRLQTINNEVTVLGFAEGYENTTILDIPKTYKGNPITKIGHSAFRNNKTLEQVIFQPGTNYITIDPAAFYGCSSLSAVAFSDRVDFISSGAFTDCISLSELFGYERVESIGTEAFFNCQKLESFTIYNNLTSLGDRVFKNSGLTKLTVDRWNTELGAKTGYTEDIFDVYGYSVALWKVQNIGHEIFANTKLTSIPNGIRVFAPYMFSGCKNLKDVTIPDAVYEIPPFCFAGCVLNKLELNQTRKIWSNAFYYIYKPLTINGVVEDIQENAFFYVQDLTINNSKISAIDTPDGQHSYLGTHFGTVRNLTFASNGYIIGANWASNSFIFTVSFPIYASIGKRAFSRCPQLTTSELTLNSGTIGSEAFYGSKITSINLTGNTLRDGALNGLNISSLTIDKCPFTSETFLNSKLTGFVSVDNCDIPANAFAKQNITGLTIGANVKSIGEDAFAGCSSLADVDFKTGASTITINSGAFANCPELLDMKLGENVIVKKDAFKGSFLASDYSDVYGSSDLTIAKLSNLEDGALNGAKFRTIRIEDVNPTGNALKNTATKWIEFKNATRLGDTGMLEGSTVEAMYAEKLQEITQKAIGTANNLRNLGTIKNEYISTTAFDLGCVYSADRKTLLFICPGINEALLDERVEKIDLRGTDFMAPGDRTKCGIPVIDARAITNHKVTPINDDGTHACAKYIRIATGCRKYFAEFENISNFYRPTLVQDYIQGDVNDDGKVSVADVMNVYDQLK